MKSNSSLPNSPKSVRKVRKPSVRASLPATLKIEESFLRETEKSEILQFLDSKDNILHIAGSPGSGKTITIKFLLKDTDHSYFNYLINKNFTTTKNLIVFDEFDKFYGENRIQCLNFLQKNKKKKIITISNDLLFSNNNLLFKPYTKEEIVQIVKKKINTERIPDFLINLISLKESNDLRKVLNICNDLLLRNSGEISITNINKNENKKLSIHQQIISKVKQTQTNKNKVFREYLEECKALKITGLDRMDFTTIFEDLD